MDSNLAKPLSASKTQWEPSQRIMQLRADHEASQPGLGAERAIHYTDFYRRTRERSAPLRKAKALADHLKRRKIQIYDGELIVGNHTEFRIGAICYAELAGLVMLEDIFRFETRKTDPLQVDPASKRKLLMSVIPYWLNRHLAAKAFPFGNRIKYLKDQLKANRYIITEAGGVAHFAPNYEHLLEQGSEGLRARIEARLEDSAGELDRDQQDQLQANLLALNALEMFADRYRDLAITNGQQDIANMLGRVPRRPARNLRDALQMIWLTQVMIQIESLDQGVSLGRLDQYLYPIYLREVAEGTFDPDAFRDLFCAFCLKLSEVIPLFSERLTEVFAGLPIGQALTLGGINREGGDASNPITFMLLDVIDRFKTRQPNWHARINRHSNSDYVKRVFEVIGRGGGSPAVYNDEAIIAAMEPRFPGKDNLWNYCTIGCVELALPGSSFTSSDAALFNYPRILETVLARMADTSAPEAQTMEDVFSAVEVELRSEVACLKADLDAIELSNRNHHPVPFSSVTVEGCIETATDLTAGGARFNATGIQGVGLADIANSLAAIEEMVFIRGEITLSALARACASNFKDCEALQARLAGLSKFGNDTQRVDEISSRMMALFDKVISENKNTRGGRWMAGAFSMTCHRSMGRQTGALPSGRRSGEPFADGIAPVDGSDYLGPTASLNSVAKLDACHMANGVNLNLKFDARTVSGPKGAALLEGLIRGYFSKGGMQAQINVLDPQVLIDARDNPDRHRNLLVRISGYSAYFVDLTPDLQDEIIERTLQAA